MAEQPFKVRKLNINGSYILASDFDPSETGLYAPVPSLYFRTGTTLIYTKTGNQDTDWIPLENTDITDLINSIFTATGEPTGFPIGEDGEVDRSSSTISFNSSNRTFTITPTTTSYYFFVKGVKYTKTTSSSVSVDSQANTYYIYFDNDGDLQYFGSSSFPKDILLNYTLVALVVWNGTSAVHIGDERHGCSMDAHTHIRLHTNQGSVYQSGLAMNSFVIDGDGSLDTHAQFSIDSGSFRDEDILHTLNSVTSTSAIPEFYRTGSGTWNRGIKTNFKFLVSTNSLIEYNQLTGGTWSRTEVASNKFVLRHVLATNDIDYPFFSLMGLAEYGNVSEARENALTELSSYSGLPFVEFVPIATYIIQSNEGYTNSVNAKIVSTDSGSAYIDWRRRGIYLNPNVSEVNIHNSLSGLEGGGSGFFYHSNQPISTLDDVEFNSLELETTLSIKGEIVYTTTGELTSNQIESDYSIIKLNPNSTSTLHGIGNPTDGKIVIIQNISSSIDITIKNQSSTETTASNRLITGSSTDFILKKNASIIAIYTSESRWRFISINIHNSLGNIQGGDDINTNYYHANQPINNTDSPTFNGLNLGMLNFGANAIVASGNITSGLFSAGSLSHWYYSQATNSIIHGIGKTVAGSNFLIISNIGSAELTIANNSATETVSDRKIITGTGSNIILKPKTSISLIYDTISNPNSWRVIGINRHNYFTDIQGGDGTNYYHSDQEINIASSPSFAGITIANLDYPSTDGSSGQFITTDGAGNLSFGSPVLDSYIIRYTSSLDLDATTTLATVIGSSESGMYRFWLSSDPRIRGVLYVKSSDLSNSELEIASNKVTGITNTANCLNVYFNSNNIVFQNKVANDTLVILKIN